MENIHNIEIKNFKSIRHASIDECKRINVFVGPPNVGKSNILEALGLFSMLDPSFGTSLSLQKLTRITKASQLFFDGLITEHGVVSLNRKLTMSIEAIPGIEIAFNIASEDNTGILEAKGQVKAISYKNHIDRATSISSHSTNYKYNEIKPIRKYVFDKQSLRSNFETNSKYLITPFGENMTDIIFSIPEVKNKVLGILNTFKLKTSRPESSGIFSILKELSDGSFLILDFDLLAETLQRLIFHHTAILSNNDAILLFEEPESHLYEPYILDITNAIKYDKNNNQYFIVTHNQYFIDELLRDEESRNETNIYMVGLENGETAVRWLSPEKSEDVFNNGLNIFFNYENLWKENA